jgi:hypothetical protein
LPILHRAVPPARARPRASAIVPRARATVARATVARVRSLAPARRRLSSHDDAVAPCRRARFSSSSSSPSRFRAPRAPR